MKKSLFSVTAAILGVGLLLTYFTNCDVYSENNLFAELESRCVDKNECINQSSDFMELKINSENNLPIGAAESEFDVGGDCNEGGFIQNVIVWELYLDNAMIQSSQMLGLNGLCINGRFAMRVRLPRMGLLDAVGVRREHRLDVEIVGLDAEGKLFKNSLLGRKNITLVPR
ncbi:MAG: hypothetical protein IT288_13460 [Bdellovibrionales bacterium]|nr:hypothetical protein [Bdellovibrionales bacterium]